MQPAVTTDLLTSLISVASQQSPNQPAPIDRTQVAIGLAMLTR
jgi:hypothetical protein